MTRNLLLLAAILGSSLAFPKAAADVVWLTTGEYLEGEVHELGNGKVRVRLGHGSITVKKNTYDYDVDLNSLEKLKAEGKQLVIRGAGEMIIALFAVMGIPKVARIIPRK